MNKIKKLTNFKLFLNKLNKSSLSYLNLIHHNNNYYINNCCENISDKLSIRTPNFIIIDNNNKYDVLKIVYLSNIEYVLNLSNYGIELSNAKKKLLYDRKYTYRLYAHIGNNIEIYELLSDFPKNLYKPVKSIPIPAINEPELKKYINYINKLIKDYLKENDLKKIAKCVMNDLIYIKELFNKKTLLKTDYIKLIKKIYPYYINLNKYKVDKLKKIYNFNCKTIKLNYNNFSCYIDSLIVALFNSENPIVEQIILNSPLNERENKKDSKLIKYGEQIREELKSIYKNLSIPSNTKTTATKLRLLLQKYYDRYKLKINKKYSEIEFTKSQNDIGELLNFLNLIFDFPDVMKFSFNGNIQNRGFFDINNDINFLTDDDIYIKKYYPKYTNISLLDEKYYRTDKFEYLSAPILFIQINRIINMEKKHNIIIPPLKLKLKENTLYLNSIIIHHGIDYNNGHYICLYECKGIWYEFNDMRGYNIKIGSFKDVLSNEDYTSNLVGLFYISI
jgi:hypothetical protein